MAYGGQGYMPTIGGRMYATARFNDQSIADAFAKAVANANPGFQGVAAGQYFTGEGGTQYKTVAGIDPNQPGWGNMVEPGYELVGYQAPEMYTGKEYGWGNRGAKTPGFSILRKQAPAPAPPPAAAPAPAPPPAPITPKTPYTSRIPELEQEIDEAEQAVPGIPDPMQLSLDTLTKQYQDLADLIKGGSTAEVEDVVAENIPEVNPELVKANAAIENIRNLMIDQSKVFEEQTAAKQLETKMMLEQQAQSYQSNIRGLQQRLNQEAENYKAQLQGLAESQRAAQINQARAALAPEFQIRGSSTQQIGGTAPFRIRRPTPTASSFWSANVSDTMKSPAILNI